MANLQNQSKSKLRWKKEEQKMIEELYVIQGKGWKEIAANINSHFPDIKRNAKQCRERYANFIKFEKYSKTNKTWQPEEEKRLHQLFLNFGSKWVQISQKLQGRSPNDIKNKFYGSMRKFLTKFNNILKNSGKNKKQVTYCSILSILEINIKQLVVPYSEELNKQKIQLIQSLKLGILNFSSSCQNDLPIQQAFNLIEKINRFNVLTRPDRLKQLKNSIKKKSMQNLSQKSQKPLTCSKAKKDKTQTINQISNQLNLQFNQITSNQKTMNQVIQLKYNKSIDKQNRQEQSQRQRIQARQQMSDQLNIKLGEEIEQELFRQLQNNQNNIKYLLDFEISLGYDVHQFDQNEEENSYNF